MDAYEIYAILFLLIMLFVIMSAVLSRSRKKFAMPDGKAVYGDLMAEGKILRSRRYGLTGKPDKIVQNGKEVVPYEYKSTDAVRPREGHMLQMAAYFVILEENFPGSKVEYGILKYKNYAFRIENSQRLREELFNVMGRIRGNLGMPEPNHNNPGRCVYCSFRGTCSKKLIK
ncbi:MAG TPA: CRISPR-associated protein Cas4 [Thermoplasmataceae archaeon]|nr:CRISPR-associated protein Cas4 [Thermoplasmataceae archaeon]